MVEIIFHISHVKWGVTMECGIYDQRQPDVCRKDSMVPETGDEFVVWMRDHLLDE